MKWIHLAPFGLVVRLEMIGACWSLVWCLQSPDPTCMGNEEEITRWSQHHTGNLGLAGQALQPERQHSASSYVRLCVQKVCSQVRNCSSLRISVTVPAIGEDDMRNGVDLGNVFKQGDVMKDMKRG